MTRCLIAVLTAASAWVALADARQATFRGGTNTVSVYATVVDRGGRLVPDLTRDDFQVFDNGRPQPLTIFKNDLQPITIVIMLDRSGSMLGNFAIERAAAERFVAELQPADKARLGSFSNGVRIDPPDFTHDRNELVRILHEKLLDTGATPLWNATFEAMQALSGQDGRRVVLVFTDGYDSPARTSGNITLPQVVAKAQTDEVMVYAIGLADSCGVAPARTPSVQPAPRFQWGRPPRGPRFPGRVPGGRRPRPPVPPRIPGGLPIPGTDAPGGIDGGRSHPSQPSPTGVSGCPGTRPDPGLKQVADEGGGGYFELHAADDLGASFSRVAEELHHQYLLAFTAEQLDGTLHRLEVRVRNPELIVRARKSYVAEAGP